MFRTDLASERVECRFPVMLADEGRGVDHGVRQSAFTRAVEDVMIRTSSVWVECVRMAEQVEGKVGEMTIAS